MNFIFISPQFPRTYWNWCDRLKKNGANVLGIGDTPYDDLAPELKQCLTEYYKVGTLEDYDQNTARSTGWNPTMNTGWNMTPCCERISTSSPVRT